MPSEQGNLNLTVEAKVGNLNMIKAKLRATIQIPYIAFTEKSQ